MFLSPYPCLIATLILLFTASTRALETPSSTDLRMPSRLRLTFLESSTNCGILQRHAHESHRPSRPAASAGRALKTARSPSLSRYPRRSAAPERLSAPSAEACPSLRSSGFLSSGNLRPLTPLAGSAGASSPLRGLPRPRLGRGALRASRHASRRRSSSVFSQAKLSALSMDFFRVPARNFSGFRHGRAAATFLTFPA